MGLVASPRSWAWPFVAGLLLLGSVAPARATPPQSVLILAEGPVLPYGAFLREHLIASLRRDSEQPLNIYEELIDRIRFDSDAYDRQLVAMYKAKYVKEAAPAVVITITEPALDFAVRHRRELFPQAALLFGAVDERALRGRDLGGNATGVFSRYDARATVEAALALHPRVRRVVVVGGASRLDRGYIDVARQDLSGLASPATVTYLTGKRLGDVLADVAALGDDALVVFLSMQNDADGVARTGPEVLAALRGVARVPIYGMSGNFLGRGIVGGVLFDMLSHGSDLAQRGRQLLSGARADDLLPIRSANSLAFDARELKRFGIDEAALPAGARVINRDLSLWDAYKRTILIVTAVLVGQFLLIGGLLLQRQRRRHAERALRDLSGRLLTTQEDERRRIARELHDNVSQQVALLAIRIDQVAKSPDAPPDAVARSMRELRQRTVDISTEIHALSHQLHSVKLDVLGLVEALRGHCHDLEAQGLHVTFEAKEALPSVPPDVALCLFRVVQEALNNSAKYSGASEARVTLEATRDRLVLRIVDAGRGFDPAAADNRGGLGLASMRERLRLVDGDVTVTAQPGRGTTITARVPHFGSP